MCCVCDRDWLLGAAVNLVPVGDYAAARKRFPGSQAVSTERKARAEDL